MKLKTLLSIGLLFIIFINSYAQEKVHLINVIATDDPDYTISNGALRIKNDIQTQFKNNLIDKLGYEVIEYDVTGKNFNEDKLKHEISNLECQGDIVIFLYAGHGFRYDNEVDELPHLKLNYEENEFTFGMSTRTIINGLKAKKPSTLITIINSCNNVPSKYDLNEGLTPSTQGGYNYISGAGSSDDINGARLEELFNSNLQDKGMNMVTLISCSKNQQSWFNVNGGFFHEVFMTEFNNAVKSEKQISWNDIATETQKKTAFAIGRWNENHKDEGLQIAQCPSYIIEDNNGKIIYSKTCENNDAIGGNTADISEPTSISTLYEYQEYINGTKKPPFWLARNFVKLGDSYINAGGNDEAIRILSAAEPVIKSKPNEKYLLASLYENMGLAYLQKQDYEVAKSYLLQARSLYEQTEAKASVSVIDALLKKIPDNK
jgi:tetratricopeptide (TPR) repeat protein